jgi:flagellar motor switch protein FliN/FliY
VTTFEEIAHLSDIPTAVTVELDRVTMTIRDILAMTAGTVIATSRAAGENIDISIGGARLGSGEIVIIEDRMGVRITDFREET